MVRIGRQTEFIPFALGSVRKGSDPLEGMLKTREIRCARRGPAPFLTEPSCVPVSNAWLLHFHSQARDAAGEFRFSLGADGFDDRRGEVDADVVGKLEAEGGFAGREFFGGDDGELFEAQDLCGTADASNSPALVGDPIP